MNTKLFAMISLGMGCFFILAGILMWVYPPKSLESWNPSQLKMLGTMIGAYGIFRTWRAYRMLRQP